MTLSRLILVSLLALVIAVIAWITVGGRWSSKPPPNILLISMDTCRADHLGCYGRQGAFTRHIDALAGESVLFSNVISPVPLTLPSHSSIMTGTIPPYHGVHDNLHYKLGDSNVTLAELLKAQGYQTAAGIGAFVLDRSFGLSQGFDTYNDEMPEELTFSGGLAERRGEEVSRFADEWLRAKGSEPFFLFLHFFDPHSPYRPPGQFLAIFAADLYAGEIAYTDNCIGQVLQTLRQLKLYDSTMIIVLADHGEGLGQHDEVEHGYFVYHSTTKVPLIIKLPGSHEPRTIQEKVGLIDILPTVLSLAGLPIPSEVQGVDLSPLMSGAPAAATKRRFYSESLSPTKFGFNSMLAVETNDWKYIQTTNPELYDLKLDPGELNNLFAQKTQQAMALQAQLRTILEQHLRAHRDENVAVPDAASLQRLQGLGYVDRAVTESFEFDTTAEDPKAFVRIYSKIGAATVSINDKDYAKARALCEEILAEKSDIGHVHILLGQIAYHEGDLEQAIIHHTEGTRIRSDIPAWQNDLGLFLAEVGRLDDAVSRYDKALKLVLDSDDQRMSLDQALAQLKRVHPLLPQIHFNRGHALYQQRHVEEAIEEYQNSLRNDPENPDVHYNLGAALRTLGRMEDAGKSFSEALRLNPDHSQARRALSNATGERGNARAP